MPAKTPSPQKEVRELEAHIENARVTDVFSLWPRKPRALAFNDTDAVIVTAKAGEHQISDTFFTCIKPDGTFNPNTASRVSQTRRNRLKKFLLTYITDDPEHYDLKQDLSSWKGKKVKIRVWNGEGYILTN